MSLREYLRQGIQNIPGIRELVSDESDSVIVLEKRLRCTLCRYDADHKTKEVCLSSERPMRLQHRTPFLFAFERANWMLGPLCTEHGSESRKARSNDRTFPKSTTPLLMSVSIFGRLRRLVRRREIDQRFGNLCLRKSESARLENERDVGLGVDRE